MKKAMILAMTFMALLSSRAHAQDAEPADTTGIAGYEMLDELVVTGEKPLLQSNGAKTTYNVEEDPGASASNVLDMLRKVPMVTVDGEGNVSLNGQSGFKFQVNGVDNPMLSQYASQVLKAMPASSVVKIEVITEPGAKEDAEGVGGIINIITQRAEKQDGYFGNLNANIGNRDYGVGAYGIVKKDKVTLSANVNYQASLGRQKNNSISETEYISGDSGSLLTETDQSQKFQYAGGNLDFSWEPNADNLFNAGANVSYVTAQIPELTSFNTRFDAAGKQLWSMSQGGDGHVKFGSVSANASYRHNFAPQGHNLILSYQFNYGLQRFDIARFITDATDYTGNEAAQEDRNTNYTREHTVQLDYANNFRSEHHLLEAGAKGIFRRNSADSESYEGESLQTLASTMLTSMRQPQDIYALYASYTGTFGNLSALAGLRYEHSSLGIKFRKGVGGNFTQHLNDLVPNAALTWNFGMASNLRLAYQMRISRPSIEQVNPYAMQISSFVTREGNPNLSSERSHKISLTHSQFGRVFGGSIGVEYLLNNNAITSLTLVRPLSDGNFQTVSTYGNIGRSQQLALNGFLNWNIISHMSVNLSGRLAYNSISAPSENLKNHGWSGNINGSWNYTVSDVWRFNAYGGWSSESVTLQGHDSGWFYYGISASRDLLADKSLNIGINANNFFHPHNDYRSVASNHSTVTRTCWTNLSNWRVGLSLTWKFGHLQAQVKKTGARLDADDASSASNKSQGSSL